MSFSPLTDTGTGRVSKWDATASAAHVTIVNQSTQANGVPVDTLSALGTPRSIAIGASSINLALTTTCRRISIYSTVAAFYQVGVGAQTATTSTHFIGPGERLEFDIAASSQIAVVQSSASGTLYISELTAP